MSDLPSILRRCREALTCFYGERFRGLILFGSCARWQASPESDVDLLVLLSEPLDLSTELRHVVEALYPIQLDCDRHISAKPAPAGEYERGAAQIYRTIRREGVLV